MSPPPRLSSSTKDGGPNRAGSIDEETTPLLSSGRPQDGSSPLLEDGPVPQEDDKPLPLFQVFLICFARLMEPIAFFAIFPFVAQMVQRNGDLPDSDVGFYSGMLESLFSLTQVLVLIPWGRLSDSIGRKPVIIISLVAMTIASLVFTMSTTIWQMLLYRSLAGFFSGSSLVLRTMLSDHCTPKTQALAFSWFAFAGNVGIFLGPILGGFLADPVATYPSVFGGIAFLEKYPYALVGITLAIVNVSCIVPCVLFLEETLKPEDDAKDSTSSEAAKHKPSIMELLKLPGVAITVWVYTHFLLLAFAYTAILPVVLFTPVAIGGIGFSSFQISIFMTIVGASQALWLLLVFPKMQRRIGTQGVLDICGNGYPLLFLGFILMNVLLRIGTQSTVAWTWMVGIFCCCIGPGVSMSFTGVQLAINDISPNPHVLGTLNAIAMTSSSAVRSFVPGLSTAMYAVGVRNQILWGHLAWVVLIPVALVLKVFIGYMPERVKRDNLRKGIVSDDE